MKPFLKELAEIVLSRPGQLDDLTFVFPNRRAALYFQNYLSLGMNRPQWAPGLFSIEEYFKRLSNLEEPDRLTLIHKLYGVYQDTVRKDEPFDKFYYWGEMLLRDFDELDKYMVNAHQLFQELGKLKELDETFDYLTEEQKKFLTQFWSHFDERPSGTKAEFLRMWRKLPKVYAGYTRLLKADGLGYEGMIQKGVAETIMKKMPGDLKADRVVFAGFNALTTAERVLISTMTENGARVYWDVDSYYMDNDLQEAGQFLRQYRKDKTLGKTFPSETPGFLLQGQKEIRLTGVPQRIGQAKLAGQDVSELLKILPRDNLPLELSKTVIVLPDEGMLLPVLHSLPDELEDVNVTMGFPLRHTPLFTLIDQIVEMQVKERRRCFPHREVNAILGHAYFAKIAGHEAQELRDQIIAANRVFVSAGDLKGTDPLFDLVFKPVDPAASTAYLLEITEYLGVGFSDKKSFDREYAYHFHRQISRLQLVLTGLSVSTDWRGFQKLFRQVIMSQRIPFYGVPLRGLQIMGVLETRNLDFDHVIFMSVNEGLLPAGMHQGSYIPQAIRKAYGLPTIEHHDAIYAYLFYRLLQRADTVSFYFNTEPDVLGNGEMSRYVQQLLLESKLPVKKFVLHNPVHVQPVKPIVIRKTETAFAQLNRFLIDGTGDSLSKLTPSRLNDYVECSLRFYFRYIARLEEAGEVEDDVDARMFGNIVHHVLSRVYDDLRKGGNGLVAEKDLTNARQKLAGYIDEAFRKQYFLDEGKPVVYEGQRIVVREVAMMFVDRVLEVDAGHAPFEITMVEEPFAESIELSDGRKVKIGGTIDRADRKDGHVRLIDYKTGGDALNFEGIEALFARDVKRSKAAFQTILYAFVYRLRNSKSGDRLQPGLMNRGNLFKENFIFGHMMGKKRIEDVSPHLPEFELQLKRLLVELFDPDVPFRQTSYQESCTYCSYKAICRR